MRYYTNTAITQCNTAAKQMQAIYNIAHANNCTLLYTLCEVQQCKTSAEMLRYCDNLLDELNGLFETDMQQCGLRIDGNGDVCYTAEMTYEHAQQATARVYAHALHEMLEENREDADYATLQRYCMLAIVQRDMFVEGTL